MVVRFAACYSVMQQESDCSQLVCSFDMEWPISEKPHSHIHGRNLVGDTGDVSPSLF